MTSDGFHSALYIHIYRYSRCGWRDTRDYLYTCDHHSTFTIQDCDLLLYRAETKGVFQLDSGGPGFLIQDEAALKRRVGIKGLLAASERQQAQRRGEYL